MVVMVASCAKEDIFEEPTLVLSENNLTFAKGLDEKTVSITTNQSNWVASSPQEGKWLSIVQDGNDLKLKVTENKLGEDRQTYVLVNANGASGKINLKQSAADVVLDVMPDTVYFPREGGSKVVDVTTNTTAYDLVAEDEADWLEITKGEEEVKLKAQPNDTNEPRTLKLFAKSGNQAKEIVIKQAGKLTYILAINPGNPVDVHKIMSFELGRGSYLRDYQNAYPQYGMEEMYTFVTASPIFTLIQYSTPDGVVPSSIVTVGDGKKAVKACKSSDFEKFLFANGYRRVDPNSKKDYISDKEMLKLNVTISEKSGQEGVNMTFRPFIKQDAPHPTFASLPYCPLELLQKENKKVADVEAFERSVGSQETSRTMNENNPSEVEILQYKMAGNTQPFYSRGYIFYDTNPKGSVDPKMLGSVETGILLFEDMSLGLWKNGKDWLVTEELTELLGKEGFIYIKTSGTNHFFGRESDRLVISVTPISDDNRPVLALLFSYRPEVFKSNSLIERTAVLRKTSASMMQQLKRNKHLFKH
jgi:putative lipoprotein